MNDILQTSQDLHKLLSKDADALAKETGFVQRKRKFSGSTFALSVIFGWLFNPQSSCHQLAQRALIFGVDVSDQGLDKRFSEQAAQFMRKLLERALAITCVSREPRAQSLLTRFKGVYLYDSSSVTLPNSFQALWKGCGNHSGGGKAAIKLPVRFELSSGEIYLSPLTDGRTSDKKLEMLQAPLPKGALRIADKGFYDGAAFAEFSRQGHYWISRLHATAIVCDLTGEERDLVAWLKKERNGVDCQVLLGKKQQMPVRLIAVPVDNEVAAKRRRAIKAQARKQGRTATKHTLQRADWSIYVTNVAEDMLSVAELEILVRCRWQIELLFKRWKSLGQIDESRSGDEWRILTEVYAKLLAMILGSRLIALLSWSDPRASQWKQLQIIAEHALILAHAFVKGAAEVEQQSQPQ